MFGCRAVDKRVLLQCARSIEYYAGNTLSVEIVKENHLQKIYFPFSKQKRVSHNLTLTIDSYFNHFRLNGFFFQNLIRPELKESLKWNINRTSPSEKIRDFMVWAKLIMNSMTYQQKLQKNLAANTLTRYMSELRNISLIHDEY